MTRDYKRAAQNKKTNTKSMPGWLLFFAGLSLGLFTTFILYLQDRSSVLSGLQPTKNNAPVVDMAPDNSVPDVKTDKKTRQAEQKTTAKKDTQKQNKEPAPPRFDFYTILPELELIIPDEEIKKKKPRKGKESVQVKKTGAYILQAGSFKHYEQADRRKAKLALLGVNATIQRVVIQDNEVWFRVRVGPFEDLKSVNNTRTKLYKNKINSIALKVRAEK